jgi:outer membrane protein assembly factor BamB
VSHRSILVAVALVLAMAGTSPAVGSTGWAQEGYDSGHSNANSREWRLRPENVGRLRLRWSRSVRGADQGWIYEHIGLPVVRAAAYAWWRGEGVEPPRSVALSIPSGRPLWLRSQEWAVAASSAQVVYANAGSWRVLALDAVTGERRWARWGMRVFAATPSGGLVVRTREGVGLIDASDGQDVWARSGIVVSGYPLSSRGVIVVRAERGPGEILGLDVGTGDTLWRRALRRHEPGGWNSSSPEAAARGLVYVVERWHPTNEATTLRALRLEDGSIAWRRVLRDDVPRVSAVGGGSIFVTRGRCASPDGCIGGDYWRERGAMVALDADTGRTLWTRHGLDGSRRPLWDAGAVANGVLYVSGVRRWGSESVEVVGRIGALSASTGRIRWTTDIHRAFVVVEAVADGKVYAATTTGPRGGRILAYGLPHQTGREP